jgi:membrane protein
MQALIKETFRRSRELDHAEYSAALAFYVMVSIIPLIVLTVTVFSFAFPLQNVEQEILGDITSLLGQEIAQAVGQLVETERDFNTGGLVAAVWGIGTLVWAASRMFQYVYLAINEAWGVDDDAHADELKEKAQKRGLTVLFALLTGLAIYIISFADTIIRRFFADLIPAGIEVRIGIFILSFLLFAFLFAGLYKVLPDEPINWRDALVGGGVTALLFMVGQVVISLLFESRSITASVGLAGAILLFMTWVYYSTRVFMVGATFTHIYANRDEVRASA